MLQAMSEQLLSLEWTTLQNNHESHERGALLIKLAAVALFVVAMLTGLDDLVLDALLLVLWFQESMLKTWQARLSQRLLELEALFARGPQDGDLAFQLHSRWQAQRPPLSGLLLEYCRSAARPTVAFPYALLILLTAFL